MERRFRLQPVLHYRANREEVLQLELARLQSEEAAARGQLDALRTESDRSLSELGDMLRAGAIDVGAVEQGFVYAAALQRAIVNQINVVHAIAVKVEAKREEVIQAMQDRKVLEKLKQRHERAYDQWATRIEQRRVEDMVTMRYNRRAAAGEETTW